jgi:hypothetical protein
MTQLLEVPTECGDSILIEIRTDDGQERRVGTGAFIEKTSKTLEAMLARVRPLADAARAAIKDSGPDEMTLEVGVNFTTEGNVFFASTSAEANFKLSLTWKQNARTTDGN